MQPFEVYPMCSLPCCHHSLLQKESGGSFILSQSKTYPQAGSAHCCTLLRSSQHALIPLQRQVVHVGYKGSYSIISPMALTGTGANASQ